MEARAVAIAVDLGSTRVKGALLADDGALASLSGVDAPHASGAGLVRESDPRAWASLALELVEALRARAGRPGVPLGLSSQRSSFLLWDRRTGEPATALISWQDRRAASWCERHASLADEVIELTGLWLSPHYAGPKLAALCEQHADLARGLASGALTFGTLDAWILWQLSRGAVHATDVTLAARTGLCDPMRGAWSPRLCELFGVPLAALPAIAPSADDERSPARAHLADQAASTLALLDPGAHEVLVNLGTGAFVVAPTGSRWVVRRGYLSGPLLARGGAPIAFAIEGTVNGGGATAESLAPGPTAIPERDPAPAAFALPDENGLGAPFWRAELGLTLSQAARELRRADQRRVVLEGVLFRLRGILDELAAVQPFERVLVSGGLARDSFVVRGLAELVDVPVAIGAELEASAIGAARLAAGVPLGRGASSRTVEPDTRLFWLREKYAAWRAWLQNILDAKHR